MKIFNQASLLSITLFPLVCFCKQTSKDQEEKDQQPMPPTAITIEEFDSRLQIGGSYTYVTLKPHRHSSFHGNLGGAQALYEYKPLNRFYGGVKFAWKEGKTHGSAGKRSLLYFDAQERFGYTLASESKDWQLTLFSGFGYRYMGQKFHSKTEDSIHFNYNEFYFPVGMLTNYAINAWAAFGIDFIWMPQVYPTVSIVPLKGARWNLTDKLANYYVSVPFTFSFTRCGRFQLIFSPFYERWQDGHTTAKLSNGIALGLPGNTYNFYGADLNLAFNF